MIPHHMCDVGVTRPDLRERHDVSHGRDGATPRATPRPAVLPDRGGSADLEGAGPHGVEAAGGHPLRRLREAPRDNAHLRGQRDQAGTPPQGPGACPVGVLALREAPRPAAYLREQGRLQEAPAQAPGCREAPQSREAPQGHQGTAGCPAQAGRGRAAGPGARPQEGGEEAGPAPAGAGRQPRARVVRGSGLPEVRMPCVLGRDVRLHETALQRGVCLTWNWPAR